MSLDKQNLHYGDDVVIFMAGGWRLRGHFAGENLDGEYVVDTGFYYGVPTGSEGFTCLVNPDAVAYIHIAEPAPR